MIDNELYIGKKMKCKYKEEEKMLPEYENDLHDLDRCLNALRSGSCFSPSLNIEHFLDICNIFNINLDGKKILNIGAGHGVLDTYILKNFDCHIIAVEFSKKRADRIVELADKFKVRNRIFVANVDIHNFLDNNNLLLKDTFDIIMAFEVLEHLVNQEEVMVNIKKLLKIGGKLIGSVPVQPNCKQPQHLSPFSSEDDIVNRLSVKVFSQEEIPLRLPECRAIFYEKM